jgi:aspartate/methionine/tyrosine aminotransferase
MTRVVGATVVPLPILEERNFTFAPEDLAARLSPKTKLVILNSPANPTGGFLDKTDIEAVANVLRDHECYVLSDEIYSRILYSGEHYSVAAEPGLLDRTIILDGFSKTYAMTGWRLGYGIFPTELIPHIDRLAVNSVSCTNAATQMAGVAALTGPQACVEQMVAEFEKRRDFIVDGLNAIPGISCKKPLGAFYVFPNITGLGLPSKVLADRILDEAGVAVLSGTAFGEYGEGYLRLSYANSIPNIEKALDRIGALAKTLV